MGMTAETYAQALRKLLPSGRAWDAAPDSLQAGLLGALAEELARVDARALALLDEADVRTAIELTPEWERVLGLEASDVPDSGSQSQVQQQLAVRLTEDGDVSQPGWIRRAEWLGHAITLHEPQPMVCGEAECGDVLAVIGVRFVLEITTPVVLTHPAECGDIVCGDPLGAYDTQRLEAEFNRVKQAHTLLVFNYV